MEDFLPGNSSQLFRDFGPNLRTILRQGERLDNVLCATFERLHVSNIVELEIWPLLSQLHRHTIQSAQYHEELESLLSSMAGRLTYALLGKPDDDGPQPRKRPCLAQIAPPLPLEMPLEILRTILSYLSASDASLLLCATRLCQRIPYNNIKPFLECRRDLPTKMADAITGYLSHGHKLLLVGGDAELLHMRIHQPLRYWREGRGGRLLQLWLAMRVAPEATALLQQKRQQHPEATFYVQDDGKVEWRDSGGDPEAPILLCQEGAWLPPRPEWTNWRTYDTGNSLRLLFQSDLSEGWPRDNPWDEIPRVRMCPTSTTDGGHKMQRWNGIWECNSIGPSTVKVQETLFDWEEQKLPPDFALPFIDLGSSQRGRSRPIKRESSRIHMSDREAAGLLFCVEFECFCRVAHFNHQIQGIYVDGQ